MNYSEEYSRASCSWRSPNYEIEYTVQDGVVLDGNGDVVDGVEAWDDGGDASVCGIRIESLEEAQDEDSEDLYSVGWECELHFLEGLHGQEELKWLSVEIHLRDENHLKPELQDYLGFKPLHYNLSLTPELLQNNQTITFSASVIVRQMSTSNYLFMGQFFCRLTSLSRSILASSSPSTCSPSTSGNLVGSSSDKIPQMLKSLGCLRESSTTSRKTLSSSLAKTQH